MTTVDHETAVVLRITIRAGLDNDCVCCVADGERARRPLAGIVRQTGDVAVAWATLIAIMLAAARGTWSTNLWMAVSPPRRA